ncbi:uncharacterized protein LOC125044409 isoform X2 [Penaeus chinensis]|uniref:uncharacterized protein LOC125044409 isoform X2 n=1 Tax=Penaeus chinensis TaxID=139456 RepID=UPI001FB77E51|nr:uncharacterized protein LOC125044409 isoform X2 [Penaeus chinensis]
MAQDFFRQVGRRSENAFALDQDAGDDGADSDSVFNVTRLQGTSQEDSKPTTTDVQLFNDILPKNGPVEPGQASVGSADKSTAPTPSPCLDDLYWMLPGAVQV